MSASEVFSALQEQKSRVCAASRRVSESLHERRKMLSLALEHFANALDAEIVAAAAENLDSIVLWSRPYSNESWVAPSSCITPVIKSFFVEEWRGDGYEDESFTRDVDLLDEVTEFVQRRYGDKVRVGSYESQKQIYELLLGWGENCSR